MRPYDCNGGRPPKLTDEDMAYVRANIKKSLRTLAKELGVHHTSIYYKLGKKCPTQPPSKFTGVTK